MCSPRLMILDEPCAGLDPVAREHFLQFIQRIARVRGAPTMVLVTHHVEEIVPIFSHVLVLKAGRVLASGARAVVPDFRRRCPRHSRLRCYSVGRGVDTHLGRGLIGE